MGGNGTIPVQQMQGRRAKQKSRNERFDHYSLIEVLQMADETPDVSTKLGWVQLVWKAVDKFGAAVVALTVLVSAIVWQGNKMLEEFRIEQLEDKRYYRSEFKVIVDNNTTALNKVAEQGKDIEAVVAATKESLEENTEELKFQRARRAGLDQVGEK
jgi:hypothetical protein